MDNDVLHVNFTPDRTPGQSPHPPGAGRRHRAGPISAFALIFFAALFFIFLRYIHTLAGLLAIAAVLATLSTWRLARRRALQRKLFQHPVRGVSLRTYVSFLAVWFFGLLFLLPLLLLAFSAAMVVLSVIALVVIILLILALFSAS